MIDRASLKPNLNLCNACYVAFSFLIMKLGNWKNKAYTIRDKFV